MLHTNLDDQGDTPVDSLVGFQLISPYLSFSFSGTQSDRSSNPVSARKVGTALDLAIDDTPKRLGIDIPAGEDDSYPIARQEIAELL